MSELPDGRSASASEREASRADAAGNPIARRLGSFLLGCVVLIFLLWVVAMIVLSIIGLITGYLYLPPARGSREIELHGAWARIVSAIILLFFALIILLILRNARRRRKPKILGD